MAADYFYLASLDRTAEAFDLEEPASRHIVQVLRMQEGDGLVLTDGRGLRATASILRAHKQHCRVRITGRELQPPEPRPVSIALSLLKNSSRFEWFLEKATELGVAEIIPLKCGRTEKQQFRMDRMRSIMESALIQSQQVWMPVLREPLSFAACLEEARAGQLFIAHCAAGEKRRLAEMTGPSLDPRFILIGPEGDFTEEEIRLAFRARYISVSLGEHRLRSETAALAAAVLLKLR